MVFLRIFQMRPRYYRDRLLNSDVHLVCRQVLHLELLLVHLHRRIHRQRLLVADHQNHLGDLHLGEVRQSHLGDLHLDRLGEVRQSHLGDLIQGDLRLDGLVHLGVRLPDEVRQLLRHQDEVQRCRMKMDCCPREEVEGQK
jgi:hypothetical protein